MTPERILQHIDNTVVEKLLEGKRWYDIMEYLNDNIKRYTKRETYVQVSESYLVKNWNQIPWNKRMTTMLVIQSLRRVKDIKWIIKKHKDFPQYGSIKMYKIISLKDKLEVNYSSVSKSSNDSKVDSSS